MRYNKENKGERGTDMRKFSIIVPCYQIACRVGRLFSMLAPRDYADYEVIFVDDCSPDGSYALMCEAAVNYPNFRVLQTEKNGGPGVARNCGLSHAEGEYILFCDSDDELDITALDGISSFLASHPTADMLVFPYEVKKGKRLSLADTYPAYASGELLSPEDVLRGHVGPTSKVFRRALIAQNALAFPPRMTGEDVCFLFHFCAVVKEAYKLDIPYYRYIMRRDSLTHSKKTRFEKTTIFEEVAPLLHTRFPELEVEQFVFHHLLTRAKQMTAAGCSNAEIRAFFEEENRRYPNWIAQFDLSRQSLYRRLILTAMSEADPIKIKWIMKLRELLY